VVVRRNTWQREAVRGALGTTEGFVSAQTLHAHMRDAGSAVGLATVYRALGSVETDIMPIIADLQKQLPPGDTITVDLWKDGRNISFEARVKERGATVIKNGLTVLRA